MRPSFYPRLINGPFDDPGPLVPFIFEKRAVLFDLGDISSLSTRDILKIDHIFITHTHMDHFVGFDRLLRLLLGREKSIFVYGPQGFLQNVEGKLAGYTWNLVNNYDNRFILHVTEVRSNHLLTQAYPCQSGFHCNDAPRRQPFNPTLLAEPSVSVSTVVLDHEIPCLGFSLKERFHVNIKKEAVLALGLEIGPWLNTFKQALFSAQDPSTQFEVPTSKGRKFQLGELARKIALITPGQKVTYIVDVGYTQANVEKIVALAAGSDHLFIEAAFLEKHRQIALAKRHLTAHQAGTIARRAGVKQLTCFHFSPRYTDQGHLLQEEAMQAFNTTSMGH